MSLEPEPVDSVLSYAVLHHLPEHLDEVVAMIRRGLTPGSVFICLEPVCSPSQPPQSPKRIPTNSTAPRNQTEAQLAAIWADLLKRPAVSINDVNLSSCSTRL